MSKPINNTFFNFSNHEKSTANIVGNSRVIENNGFFLGPVQSVTTSKEGVGVYPPQSFHISTFGLDLPVDYDGSTDTVRLNSTTGVRGSESSVVMHAGTDDVTLASGGCDANCIQVLSHNDNVLCEWNARPGPCLYRPSANTLAWRNLSTGTGTLTLNTTSATTASLTAPNGSLGGPGTSASPGIQFANAPTSGLVLVSPGQLYYVADGTTVFILAPDATGSVSTVPLRLPTGSAGTASMAFATTGNTGFYQPSAGSNSINMSIGSTPTNRFAATYLSAAMILGTGTALNVYDIGTTTPSMTLNGVSFPLTSHNCLFTRVGRVVQMSITLQWGTVPTQTGVWQINNILPVAATALTTTPFVQPYNATQWYNTNSTARRQFYFETSSTALVARSVDLSGERFTSIASTELVSNRGITIAFTYQST